MEAHPLEVDADEEPDAEGAGRRGRGPEDGLGGLRLELLHQHLRRLDPALLRSLVGLDLLQALLLHLNLLLHVLDRPAKIVGRLCPDP